MKKENDTSARPAEMVMRACPNCGTSIMESESVCPTCHYVFHWTRNDNNRWVRYLQSPFSQSTLVLALFLAIIGQLLIFFTDSTISEFIPIPSEYFRLFGHLAKLSGEVMLLYAVMFGMMFESYSLRPVFIGLILFSCAYHLSAAFWPFVLMRFAGHPYMYYLYSLIVAFLVLYEGSYVVLGVSFYSLFNGSLSRVGLLLAIRSAAFLLFNVVLHLVGNDLAVDIAIALFTWICFYFVWDLLLDHRAYMKVPSSRREQG